MSEDYKAKLMLAGLWCDEHDCDIRECWVEVHPEYDNYLSDRSGEKQ